MNIALWIARRFSFARKRFRVVNVISAISLAGIIVGVCTLLVVMSVLNGFQKLARDLFVTLDSPVQVVPKTGRSMRISPELLHSIAALQGVASVEPFLEGEAVLVGPEKNELVMIKGLSEGAHKRLVKAKHAAAPFFTGDKVSVGELLAYRTELRPFSEISLFSPELVSIGLESLADPYLLPALKISQSSVASLFSLQKIFDDRFILASNSFAQSVLLMRVDEYSGLDIRTGKGFSDKKLLAVMQEWLKENRMEKTLVLRTLEQKYHDIFAVMELEKWVSFSVLMLVILVAALSLTGTLAMTAIDKQRELFYLRCLGLEKPAFMAIFIIQGGMTGVFGTAAGAGLAWVICKAQELYGFVELPSKSAFIIEAYPVEMKVGDFAIVAVTAIVLCLLVSLYPARKAAQIANSNSLDVKGS
ncbi:MAG: ABC transporter permease [Chlorobiaceae bacterium]|nr:ABC transporter permease [Chlorobiaceae bacterium]